MKPTISTETMPAETVIDLEELLASLEPPVLIVSTVVGRGMYTLGEAIQERFAHSVSVEHRAIEEFLPDNAVAEDLRRYKMISNRAPFLLYLIYKIPIFYYRKYLRESRFRSSNLQALRDKLAALNARTVLCISHRPGFWVSCLKRQDGMDFKLWGVLGEYGRTLGWRYLFWEQMDGFLSPIDRRELDYAFPAHLTFGKIDLPARREYALLAGTAGDPHSVLLVCGYWGQGPIVDIVSALLAQVAGLRIWVVCGDNRDAFEKTSRAFAARHNVRVYGTVDSLAPFLKECASVVTKPGISTLLEAHAARRKIFLIRGMPVAEDNNARYALRHFGAEWFTGAKFKTWHDSLSPA